VLASYHVDVIDDGLWISCAYLLSRTTYFRVDPLHPLAALSSDLLDSNLQNCIFERYFSIIFLHKRLKFPLNWKDVLNLDRGGAVSFKEFLDLFIQDGARQEDEFIVYDWLHSILLLQYWQRGRPAHFGSGSFHHRDWACMHGATFSFLSYVSRTGGGLGKWEWSCGIL
jgi:hypothetical protein